MIPVLVYVNKSEGGMPSVGWAPSPTDFTLLFVSRVATDLIAASLWLRSHVVINTHSEKSTYENVWARNTSDTLMSIELKSCCCYHTCAGADPGIKEGGFF